MIKEDKELLLIDLCARLTYGVIVETSKGRGHVCDINLTIFGTEVGVNINPTSRDKFNVEECKPYLFPLSSMTEEQKYDFYCRFIENDCDFNDFKEFYLDNGMWHKMLTSLDDIEEIIDWFNKNHFDFRCLIPKGLAIDATDKNIY
jgi:hypothetical protein